MQTTCNYLQTLPDHPESVLPPSDPPTRVWTWLAQLIANEVDCLHLCCRRSTPNDGQGNYLNRIELLQGTLDMLILKTLQWGEQHGYGISQAIRVSSGEVLQVETGSLYPALHRLNRQGWVKSEWRKSEKQPAREVLQDNEAGQGATCRRLRAMGKNGCDDRSNHDRESGIA